MSKYWHVATQNPHKIQEIQQILPQVTWVSLPPDTPQAEEKGTTFYENALQKAKFYSRYVSGPLVAEDSGLVVVALKGAPGVESATWGGPTRLLKEMQNLSHRLAYFVCVIVAYHEGAYRFFQGMELGEIAPTPQGEKGFGYDPVFIPQGQHATYAQLGPTYKNRFSHRARAFHSFAQWLGIL
ncbi:MAG: RdgB/HAM1 family non-canonical purine NTP pyrophosphatase [Bacteroidia bacterium]